MGLPNLWLYFLAARLIQLAQWFSPATNISWLIFETSSILPLNLKGVLWANLKSNHALIKHNTIISHFIQLWNRIKDNFKLLSETPPLASFLGDLRLPQAFTDNSLFNLWIKNNLTTLKSLTLNMNFSSFASLQSRFKLPSTELPQYNLIRNFFYTNCSLYLNPPYTLFDHVCISTPRDKGLISQVYNYLNNLHQPEKSGPMIRWETDIGCSFPIGSWTILMGI